MADPTSDISLLTPPDQLPEGRTDLQGAYDDWKRAYADAQAAAMAGARDPATFAAYQTAIARLEKAQQAYRQLRDHPAPVRETSTGQPSPDTVARIGAAAAAQAGRQQGQADIAAGRNQTSAANTAARNTTSAANNIRTNDTRMAGYELANMARELLDAVRAERYDASNATQLFTLGLQRAIEAQRINSPYYPGYEPGGAWDLYYKAVHPEAGFNPENYRQAPANWPTDPIKAAQLMWDWQQQHQSPVAKALVENLPTLIAQLKNGAMVNQENAGAGGAPALSPAAAAVRGIQAATGTVMPPPGPGATGSDGTVFPIVGWQGTVSPHWGQVAGGADLFATVGTPVVAMASGKVLSAGFSEVGGNNVMIQGANGLRYYYAHLQKAPLVQAGQEVSAGTPLGAVGETGNAAGTGPHLHIGIGPEIRSGADKYGGTGGDYDAVGDLTRALAAARGATAAGPTPGTSPSSPPAPASPAAVARAVQAAAGTVMPSPTAVTGSQAATGTVTPLPARGLQAATGTTMPPPGLPSGVAPGVTASQPTAASSTIATDPLYPQYLADPMGQAAGVPFAQWRAAWLNRSASGGATAAPPPGTPAALAGAPAGVY